VVGLLKKPHLLNTWLLLEAAARGAVQDHLLTVVVVVALAVYSLVLIPYQTVKRF
jgi:hypothetical protein